MLTITSSKSRDDWISRICGVDYMAMLDDGLSVILTTPVAISMRDFIQLWLVINCDVTVERRDSMKYDVMSGANIYRTGMESTLSEHHQQNAKNFDVTFERRNGVNFDVISCIYFHKAPLNIINAAVSFDMPIGVLWSCCS